MREGRRGEEREEKKRDEKWCEERIRQRNGILDRLLGGKGCGDEK